MIAWCDENLSPRASGFRFEHHNVYSAGLNPAGQARMLALPGEDGAFSLFNAWSVFTHLAQDQAEHYLREAARLLSPTGYLRATVPIRQDGLPDDAAVPECALHQRDRPDKRSHLRPPLAAESVVAAGFPITWVRPPAIRGYHWLIVMRPRGAGAEEFELPPDDAPFGSLPPPLMPAQTERIGLADGP